MAHADTDFDRNKLSKRGNAPAKGQAHELRADARNRPHEDDSCVPSLQSLAVAILIYGALIGLTGL